MNKIIIDNNVLTNRRRNYTPTTHNTITIKKNGTYNIEYKNIPNQKIKYNIKKNINAHIIIKAKEENLNIEEEYNLENSSHLKVSKYYNNSQTNENITINLKEPNSKIKYLFSNICKTKENYNITINHQSPSTTSIINNRCISLNNSSIIFTINSIIPKGNPNCIMDQNTKIIELGNTFSQINPNMFIEESNVEAKHGSVIGTFREDDIFYLTSRGIPKKQAIKLLAQGFILTNLEIQDANIQKEISKTINKNWR